MPHTDAADVLIILDLLEAAGADPVVAGGWGVDALIGRRTHPHADLDIAGRDVRRISARLQAVLHTGYDPTPVDRADMAALAAATGLSSPEGYA